MANDPFVYDDFYKINTDDNQVTLDLIFGDLGQSVDYVLALDDVIKIDHSKISIQDYTLGKGPDLAGKTLTVSGNIQDMPATSHNITLILRIKGGATNIERPYASPVNPGDNIDISLAVHFYK